MRKGLAVEDQHQNQMRIAHCMWLGLMQQNGDCNRHHDAAEWEWTKKCFYFNRAQTTEN